MMVMTSKHRHLIFCSVLLSVSGCSSTDSSGKKDTASVLDQKGNSKTDNGQSSQAGIVADHSVVAAFESIPSAIVTQVKSNLRIYYGHTSHGSQPITGLEMLGGNYAPSGLKLEEVSADLGTEGDLTWETTTRARLNQSGEKPNVVIWSWCGGQSTNTEQGVNAYLSAMAKLETDFSSISFVYMTGHTDGSGATGTLRTRNKQIRDYAKANKKLLFDFEDIESWDPAGTYYANTSDDCGWCSTWCSSHSCPSCGDCAHSHCFNCHLKGKAFWWLLARIAGWNG
jgi:hypothetical protein